MNNPQRKQLEEALNLLERASNIIISIKEEEGEKYDSLPEGLQSTAANTKLNDNAAGLEEIECDLDNIRDELSAFLQNS